MNLREDHSVPIPEDCPAECSDTAFEFRSFFEHAQEGIYRSTPDGLILLANPAFIEMLGYSSLEEVKKLNMNRDIYRNSEARASLITRLGGKSSFRNLELEWRKKDGSPITVRANGRTQFNNDGIIEYFETMVVDVTDIKLAESELKASRQLFSDIINCLPDPTFAIDKTGRVIAWNRAMEILTCVPAENMLGKGDYEYALPIYGERRPMLADYVLNSGLPVHAKYISFRREDNRLVAETYAPLAYGGKGAYLWASASRLSDSEGNIIGSISNIKDFTEYREAQKQLEYLSMHDRLTGLYNRMYFEEEMARLNNKRYLPLTVIMCDVDGLKLYNDTMGHHRGDELLKDAAATIRSPFRSSDVVARIGGDEFALILPYTDAEAAENACKRIREAVAEYNRGKPQFPLSLSIGCATGDLPVRSIFIEADNNLNREKLGQSTAAKKYIIDTLSALLEKRDFVALGHTDRLHKMSLVISDILAMSAKEMEDLILLAKYHDIGKVGIPEDILFKTGRLTKTEMEEMKRHSEIGFRLAQASVEFGHIAKLILHHHEWWNGEGYPLRLKGEEIPLICRIFSILDAYESMTNRRPYRKSMTHAQAIAEICTESGTKYDPDLVNLFMQNTDKILNALKS